MDLKKIFFKYKEQILYLFFGGCTTLVNLVVYYLCKNSLGLHYQIANVLAWIVSVAFAFITNKLFVFESKKMGLAELKKEVVSFVLARVASLLMEMVIGFAGNDLLHINDTIVKLVGQIIVIVANYFFSKFFIFKK